MRLAIVQALNTQLWRANSSLDWAHYDNTTSGGEAQGVHKYYIDRREIMIEYFCELCPSVDKSGA